MVHEVMVIIQYWKKQPSNPEGHHLPSLSGGGIKAGAAATDICFTLLPKVFITDAARSHCKLN